MNYMINFLDSFHSKLFRNLKRRVKKKLKCFPLFQSTPYKPVIYYDGNPINPAEAYYLTGPSGSRVVMQLPTNVLVTGPFNYNMPLGNPIHPGVNLIVNGNNNQSIHRKILSDWFSSGPYSEVKTSFDIAPCHKLECYCKRREQISFINFEPPWGSHIPENNIYLENYCKGEHVRYQTVGSASAKTVDAEIERYNIVYKSIKYKGYQVDVSASDGAIGVQFLISSDNDYRALVINGQHRLAAILALDYTSISVFLNEWGAACIWRNQVESWPLVLDKTYCKDAALMYFDSYFRN